MRVGIQLPYADGMSMKESIKEMLIADGSSTRSSTTSRPLPRTLSIPTSLVAKDLLEHKDSHVFGFDKYGVGSYMAAVKIKGMVVANISDERSARHDPRAQRLAHGHHGPGCCGTSRSPRTSPASSCVRSTPAANDEIRVDMLNKMA
ncbi:MAG: RpiB/LacA/LacB family sugar-phosphate isomerase [Collinsella sp.]